MNTSIVAAKAVTARGTLSHENASNPCNERIQMVCVAAVANNKGGVAKTEVVVQLAAALARTGRRVLVCDLDPQANATRRLGVEWDPREPIITTSEVIKDAREGVGEGAVQACGWTNAEGAPTTEALLIDVLPARFDLINRETEAGTVGAVRRLKKSRAGWTDAYDVVLIDTRPDLGHLVQMAFAAADTVLVPTAADYDSVEGAIRVADFVERHAADLGNPELAIGGVVVTRKKPTNEQDFQLQGLSDQFGSVLWKLGRLVQLRDGKDYQIPHFIPEWARFNEADAAAVSLSEYSDRRGLETAAIYDSLARTFAAKFLVSEKVN